jgi:hypothetical protein
LEQRSEKFIRKYQPAYSYGSNTVVAASIWSPGSNHKKKILTDDTKKGNIFFLLSFSSVVHPKGEEPFG